VAEHTNERDNGMWSEIDQKYPVGSKITGTITSIVDYGLFVEVEKGVEGLVHISEVSWTKRINNLSSLFSVGQEVDVVIIGLDKARRRMSLSIKQLQGDPWANASELFPVGKKVTGTVTNITDFGVFVQIHEGIDGLVHVSDISTEHVKHPGDLYKRGDSVDVVILSVDAARRRVSLGIKQLNEQQG